MGAPGGKRLRNAAASWTPWKNTGSPVVMREDSYSRSSTVYRYRTCTRRGAAPSLWFNHSVCDSTIVPCVFSHCRMLSSSLASSYKPKPTKNRETANNLNSPVRIQRKKRVIDARWFSGGADFLGTIFLGGRCDIGFSPTPKSAAPDDHLAACQLDRSRNQTTDDKFNRGSSVTTTSW